LPERLGLFSSAVDPAFVLKLYFGTCFRIVNDREQFGIRQIEVSAEFIQLMLAKMASGLACCSTIIMRGVPVALFSKRGFMAYAIGHSSS
jgi:hypothetical protein